MVFASPRVWFMFILMVFVFFVIVRDTGRFTGGLEVMYRPRQAAGIIYVVFKYFGYSYGWMLSYLR